MQNIENTAENLKGTADLSFLCFLAISRSDKMDKGEASPALKGGASNPSTKDSDKSDAKVLESIRRHSLFGFKAIVILSQDLAAPASITGYQDLEVAVTIVIFGKPEKATHAQC